MGKKRHELDNCTCLNLRAAARMITQHYDHRFRQVGLRSTQYNLLAAVEASGPVGMTQLADILGMDRTTLNRDLQPLKRDELVVVRKGKDRRLRLVELTSVGTERLEEGHPIWRELQDNFHRSVGKKRWKALMKELSRTVSVLQEN